MAGDTFLLSDYHGRKIVIRCPCGISKRYDADAMLDRIGDITMAHLLNKLKEANRCPRLGLDLWVGNPHERLCQLVFDLKQMGGYLGGRGRQL